MDIKLVFNIIKMLFIIVVAIYLIINLTVVKNFLLKLDENSLKQSMEKKTKDSDIGSYLFWNS